MAHACAPVSDAALDGKTCGNGLVCTAGNCVPPGSVCGMASSRWARSADLGAVNGPGKGCEINCRYSCGLNPTPAPTPIPANGVEACAKVMVNGGLGQLCNAGMAVADASPAG